MLSLCTSLRLLKVLPFWQPCGTIWLWGWDGDESQAGLGQALPEPVGQETWRTTQCRARNRPEAASGLISTEMEKGALWHAGGCWQSALIKACGPAGWSWDSEKQLQKSDAVRKQILQGHTSISPGEWFFPVASRMDVCVYMRHQHIVLSTTCVSASCLQGQTAASAPVQVLCWRMGELLM